MQKEIFGPLTFVAALWRRDYAAIARYGHLAGVPAGDTKGLARIVKERTRPIDEAPREPASPRVRRCLRPADGGGAAERFHV